MMARVTYLLIVFTTLVLVQSARSLSQNDSEIPLDDVLKNSSSDCIRALGEIDRHAKSVLLMDGKTRLPKNESLREEWCGPLKKLSKEAKAYLKCSTPFVGQLITVLVNGLKRPIKYICKGNFEKSRKHFTCINDDYLTQIAILESEFIDALYTLNGNSSKEFVLPGLCCYVNRLLDSILAIKYDKCSEPGGNPSTFLRDRIDEAIGDVLDLVCGPYPTTKICEETQAHVLEYLDKQATRNQDLKKTPFVPVLLRVMSSLAAKEEEE